MLNTAATTAATAAAATAATTAGDGVTIKHLIL